MNNDVVLPCGRLRVVFRQLADRIGHRIEVLVGDSWTAVLESVEGDENDIWPSSPALQTLHVEARPAGQVGLLVGMAGQSHWSASVAADMAHSRIAFDLACRISAASNWLDSIYRWLVEDKSAARQEIQVVPTTAILVSSDESRLTLKAEIDQNSQQRTIRWGYSIEVLSLQRR